MKSFLFAAVVLSSSLAGFQAFAHGGGCKETLVPNQCCHMDKKLGFEHCH